MSAARAIALFLAGMLAASTCLAQEDPDEKKKQAEEREKKAQDLYDRAKTHMEKEEFKDALEQFKTLRERYAITDVYFDNSEDIDDRIFQCGSRIAVIELKKQKLSRKPMVDGWYQYTYLPPEGWRGVPPFKQYSGDMDSSEKNYEGQTIRINRYTSPYLEGLHLKVFKSYAASSTAEVKERVIKDLEDRYEGLKEGTSAGFKAKGQSGIRTELKDGEGNRIVVYSFHNHHKGLALIGYWVSPDSTGWVRFVRSGDEKKKNQISDEDWGQAAKLFDQVARSFTILPQRKKGVFMPAWKEHKTRNYIIEYNTDPEYAKTLGKHMEKIMALYRAVIPTGKGFPVCRIKLFSTEEDFQYYGQAPGAAAYWSSSQEEIVAYRFSGREMKIHDETMTVTEDRNPEEETFHIIYHEGFHQYMYYLMGRERDIYVPSWLNEGMGDYFFGGTFGRKGFEVDANWWRLDTIHEAVKAGKHVPIKKIIRYTQSDYYSRAGLCYAEGWALCYFFLKSPVAKTKGWSGIPRAMLHELKTSGDWKKATDKVFGPVNLDDLEAEWKKYVLSLKPDKPDKNKKEKKGDE